MAGDGIGRRITRSNSLQDMRGEEAQNNLTYTLPGPNSREALAAPNMFMALMGDKMQPFFDENDGIDDEESS